MTDKNVISCFIDRRTAIDAMKVACWKIGEKQLARGLESRLLDLPIAVPAFKVKPLVWIESQDPGPTFTAKALGVTYAIRWYPDVGWSWSEDLQYEYYEARSEEDAKAQAQYHFEQHLRAVLEVV